MAKEVHATHMTVLHPVRQPRCYNPCEKAHCEHICLRNRNNATCACDAGFKLNADNKTCSPMTEDDILARGGEIEHSTGFCQSGCVHGRCVVHRNRELATCLCFTGYSGPHCDISDFEGSSLALLLTVLVIFILMGGTTLFFLYRYKSPL